MGRVIEVEIPYTPRLWAKPFHASFCRWAALVLHRRAGKTTCILNHHQRAATDDEWEIGRLQFLKPELTREQLAPLLRNRVYGHILPYRNQAKLVAWDMLKFYAAEIPGAEPNEVDLAIHYPNGNRVQLFGADRPDALRGPAFSGLSFDEYAQHPPNIFSEVLSKNLADHLGYGIFAGTIKGKNQLYKTYEAAKGDPSWFSLWQDIDASLETEEDVTITLLRQAMEDDRALISKGLMLQSEFDQEWYLSPEAAIKGAILGPQMAEVRRAGRLTSIPWDPALPVYTAWDIGHRDATAIWFFQTDLNRKLYIIDYYEASFEALPHFVKVLRDKPYVYEQHLAPHDVMVTEWSGGKTRLESARTLDLHFTKVPKVSIEDRINAGRLILPRCYFDTTNCERGIEALTQWRWGINENMGELKREPVHDWACHGADAFTYLAVGFQQPRQKTPRPESLRDRDVDDVRGRGDFSRRPGRF